MNFECENCHFKLTNEFCPKCHSRMGIGCDECPGKDKRILDLETQLRNAVLMREGDVEYFRRKHEEEIADLRGRYEKTVDEQWRELESLRSQQATWKIDKDSAAKIYEHCDSEAWQKVADTLDVKISTGYRIDEARVLQQLRVERSAASLLRAEVAGLKSQLAGTVDEFARQREEFLEHLQNKNGAARLEASKKEV